ncbi:MAG: aminotransferase class V-fold PLP-dependent enzyme [Chloroflexi bacterium]|nr:aminotransferase class V-fold PLP-dependent enzyme [Chloroflexota bacterium]
MPDGNAHFTELAPPQRVLMAPGPTSLPPSVLQALIAPLTGHKDPFFLRVMDETAELLREVSQTGNRTCMSLPGTGGAGMEAALANLIQPGDRAIICVNGLFGKRMADIAGRCGGTAVEVTAPWGKPVDPDDVRRALENGRNRLVAVVHGETSTGVEQPIDEIGRLARAHGAMLVVDAVATLGGIPVVPDQWGAAVCYSASQKCLSAPPGLATVTVSDEAMAYIRGRHTAVDSWYLDLGLHDRYWFAQERAYHHTAPVLLVYALREALRLVVDEGLDARFARHLLHHRALVAGLGALECDLFAETGYRLPTVVAVWVPSGVNDARVRAGLLNEFGIEIAGGLGEYAGRVWRIGVMGHSASAPNVRLLLQGLETLLGREGHTPSSGAAVAAAEAVYSAAGLNSLEATGPTLLVD